MAKDPVPTPKPDIVRPPAPSEAPAPEVVNIPTPAPDMERSAQHNAARVARRGSEGSAVWRLTNSSPYLSSPRMAIAGYGRANLTRSPGTKSTPDDCNACTTFSIDLPLPASPRSMRLTVSRDKSALSANFCCVQPRSSLPSLICAPDIRCAEMLIVMGT